MPKSQLTLDSFNKQVIDDYFRTYLFTVFIINPNEFEANVLSQMSNISSIWSQYSGLFGSVASLLGGSGGTVASSLSKGTSIATKFLADLENSGYAFKCEWIATTQTPVSTTGVQIIDWMHSQIKQSGRTTAQQWTVNVRDDAKSQAYQYFTNWKRDIYSVNNEVGSTSQRNMLKSVKALINPTGLSTQTSPRRYKRSAIIQMYVPTKTEAQRTFTLSGVWPMEIGAISLDYDSEGISVFPVTLSMDFHDVLAGEK